MKTTDDKELLQFSTDIVQFIHKMKKCTDQSYNGYYISRHYDNAERCISTEFIDQNDINRTVLEYGSCSTDCNHINIIDNEIIGIGYYHKCKTVEITHLVYIPGSKYPYVKKNEYYEIPVHEMQEEEWFQLSVVNEYSAVIQMFYNINSLNNKGRKFVAFYYDAREYNKLITRKVQCITLP